MFVQTILFILLASQSAADENVTDSKSQDIVEKINNARDTFFTYVDESLLEELQVIVKKVQDPNVDAVQAALNGKAKLASLSKKHLETFSNITAKLKEIEEIVDDIENEIMHNISLKRSQLEMLTLFSPFEYFGHKFGFERNRKI